MAGRPGGFRSIAARDAYVAIADQALERCSVPITHHDVPTPYGATHVYEAGPASAPPVVMLPGKSASVMLWLDVVLPAIAADHRVLAVDTVGDLGRSVASRVMRKPGDYVAWLEATFAALDVGQPALVGLSHGSWLAATFAVAHPDRVSRVALLAPGGVFTKVNLRWLVPAIGYNMMARSRASGMRFMRTLHEDSTWQRRSGSPDWPALEAYLTGRAGFRWTLRDAIPGVLPDDEVRRLTMPVLLVVGEHECVCDPHAMIERATRLVPDVHCELLPSANHVVTEDQPDMVRKLLVEFLR